MPNVLEQTLQSLQMSWPWIYWLDFMNQWHKRFDFFSNGDKNTLNRNKWNFVPFIITNIKWSTCNWTNFEFDSHRHRHHLKSSIDLSWDCVLEIKKYPQIPTVSRKSWFLKTTLTINKSGKSHAYFPDPVRNATTVCIFVTVAVFAMICVEHCWHQSIYYDENIKCSIRLLHIFTPSRFVF